MTTTITETMTTIKIHKEVGECITADEFCETMAKELEQTPDMIHACFDFMEIDLGLVEAMETYCSIVGYKAI